MCKEENSGKITYSGKFDNFQVMALMNGGNDVLLKNL